MKMAAAKAAGGGGGVAWRKRGGINGWHRLALAKMAAWRRRRWGGAAWRGRRGAAIWRSPQPRLPRPAALAARRKRRQPGVTPAGGICGRRPSAAHLAWYAWRLA
jgi:hypothetical protein